MNIYCYTLLTVFAIIAYIIVVDQNVAIFIDLVFKIIKVNVERFYWVIRFHPKNPITNLIMRIKYAKIAKDLERELNNDL